MAHYVRERDLTETKRALFKDRLDDFCTFSWDGVDMYDFGVFIIHKGGLKFYNGPSYSNQYTAPMFSDATGDLTGLKFSTQKISFQVGVYWFSEQEYRKLIRFLSPYRVGELVFDFEPNWGYNVKLAGIKDSTRTVLGYEDGENRYYTELTLDFEIQGEPCATYRLFYAWNYNTTYNMTESTHRNWSVMTSTNPISIVAQSFLPDTVIYKDQGTVITTSDVSSKLKGNIASDIPCGLETSLLFNLSGDLFENTLTEDDNPLLSVKMEAQYEDESVELFNVSFSNLIFLIPESSSDDTSIYFNLTYNSTDGLLFWNYDGEEKKILTRLSMLPSGERIVQTMKTRQFRMPGYLDVPTFDHTKMSLVVTFSGEMVEKIKTDSMQEGFFETDSPIIMQAKTNLI